MRVAILGATGLTGVPLVLQALAEGHEVVAVVRSAKKLDETIRYPEKLLLLLLFKKSTFDLAPLRISQKQ